jgi:hypothetical protein
VRENTTDVLADGIHEVASQRDHRKTPSQARVLSKVLISVASQAAQIP